MKNDRRRYYILVFKKKEGENIWILQTNDNCTLYGVF